MIEVHVSAMYKFYGTQLKFHVEAEREKSTSFLITLIRRSLLNLRAYNMHACPCVYGRACQQPTYSRLSGDFQSDILPRGA